MNPASFLHPTSSRSNRQLVTRAAVLAGHAEINFVWQESKKASITATGMEEVPANQLTE